jgi:hypothetical protein
LRIVQGFHENSSELERKFRIFRQFFQKPLNRQGDV